MRKYLWFLISILLIGAGFVTVNRSQDIIDWWKLKDYQPSAEIAGLSENSGMSDEGERLFYVTDPQLLDKTQFADNCTVSEETIVLGCYVTNGNIFIFDVDDERLEGIEEVTAGHEMLHVVYTRMSSSEKERINKLVREEYEKVTNERILQTVESYATRDPSIVDNELHSILGTEVESLSVELEEHYALYFDDRQKVVALAMAYENEFNKLEEQIEEYDNQLNQLQGEIARLEASISEQQASLVSERSRIERLLGDPAAYNQQVVVFNAQVTAYNNDIAQARTLIDQYNEIVSIRNDIALEEKELVDALNSSEQSLE